MLNESDLISKIRKLKEINRAYHADAYSFVLEALDFTIGRLPKPRHVSGKELSEGIREHALLQFGPMAQAVLAHWGVTTTKDFGKIVFDLLDAELLKKTEGDSIADFDNVYEFSEAFGKSTIPDSD